jgi:acetylornithine deacetylase/succinyl-diaminopimelate desuccinylase-like protein
MIPDECVIRADCRPQPGVPIEVVQEEIERCLERAKDGDPDFEAEVVLADVKPSYLASPDSEVVGLMVDAVRTVKGTEPELKAAGWLGDTASFGSRVPTVIFGPGGEPTYSANEHVTVQDIHTATKVYALFGALALLDNGQPGPQ